MFLKIATVLAFLGVLLNFVLSLVQQSLVASGYLGSTTLIVFRVISFVGSVSLNIPLAIFFIAFFLSRQAEARAK